LTAPSDVVYRGILPGETAGRKTHGSTTFIKTDRPVSSSRVSEIMIT
jgi:hypothetical protein